MRLIMGTSMGCMHSFVWGETYPDFASALMPLACEPIEIAGLNRMWRQLAINAIEADPAWQGGDYKGEPLQGLRAAENLLFVAGAAPLLYQAQYPTRAAARPMPKSGSRPRSSRWTPTISSISWTRRGTTIRGRIWSAIKMPLTWINSADDFINPRNLDVPQQALKRMPTARFRLVPESAEPTATAPTPGRNSGSRTSARFWSGRRGSRRKPRRGSW